MMGGHHRRVVISGIGLVTPLGNTSLSSWNNLINNKIGIQRIPSNHKVYDISPCKIAGMIDDDNMEIPRNTSRFTHFALIAAREALNDANYMPTTHDQRCRIGAAIGSGIGDLEHMYSTSILLNNEGYKRVSPFFVPRVLINMAASRVCMEHKFYGPCHSVSTACATGAHAIGDAARFIQMNDADIMLAGGAEACIDPLSMVGFARMRALATKYNDQPEKASRPFDKDRCGFVMSEGAGILILEELEHAKKRGAKIYGEIIGYGTSTDAYHLTQPDPSGFGAISCMKSALRHANVNTSDITYVNAHATSTPVGDEIEAKAISQLFKDNKKNIMISSTKGATGHLLGAAGAIEAAFLGMSIYHKLLPATMNLVNPENIENVDFIMNDARDWNDKIRIGVSNSFGFGSVNASLIISNIE